MAQKSYTPVASYSDLKRVESALQQAQTPDDIRKLCAADGPKVGYKAFCYLLTGKMTAEAMKPDEACETAAELEKQGKIDEAQAIYQRVLIAHNNHPLAREKVG